MTTDIILSEAVGGAVMTSALRGAALGWAEPRSPRETGVLCCRRQREADRAAGPTALMHSVSAWRFHLENRSICSI